MKALYRATGQLCTVVSDTKDGLILEPGDGSEENRFHVDYGDPQLVVDPTDRDIEMAQVAVDMTLSNARLKREVEKQRKEIASLTFQLKESQDANAALLGEHGIENAKNLVAILRHTQSQEAMLIGVIKAIMDCIPRSFFGEEE